MNETRLIMGFPTVGVIAIDGEGVDSVHGLEVTEVRSRGVRSEWMIPADVNVSSVSEESPLIHV